jgi:hypothetical protein
MFKVENFWLKLISVDFFEFKSCLKISVFSCTLFFIIVLTSSVSALGWNDKEWVEAGCPSNIFGAWVSRGAEINSKNLLNIYQDKIIFINDQNLEIKYSFNSKNMLKNGSYVGVKLQPVTKDKTTFLKIRPHLIRSKHATKQMNKTIQNCFIKVFKFESQKNAKYDKYLDWEIYKFKNN